MSFDARLSWLLCKINEGTDSCGSAERSSEKNVTLAKGLAYFGSVEQKLASNSSTNSGSLVTAEIIGWDI